MEDGEGLGCSEHKSINRCFLRTLENVAKNINQNCRCILVQGANGHRGQSQVISSPEMITPFDNRTHCLFESGREIVTLEGIVYKRTLDTAEMVDGKPTVHLRYDLVRGTD